MSSGMSMPSLHTFHAALRDGQREAGPLETRLAAAYHHVLNQYIEAAAAKLESAPGTLVAATNPQNPDQPGWTPPPAGTLIDVPALIAALRAETDPVRRHILEALVAATLDRFGISFDLSNPLLDGVFQQMGQNIQGIAETTRADIMQAVQKSYDDGLSIPHAADEIRRVAEMSKTRAVMIARTELIGASNGASLAAARLTDAAPYKTWLSAGDHRVREAHRIADGQTVPIAAPFLVGGEPLMFPGDQLNGTPDEVINCRCTLIYTDEAAPLSLMGERIPVATHQSLMEPGAVETPATTVAETVDMSLPTPAYSINESSSYDPVINHTMQTIGKLIDTTTSYVEDVKFLGRPDKESSVMGEYKRPFGNIELNKTPWIHDTIAHEYGHAIDDLGMAMVSDAKEASLLTRTGRYEFSDADPALQPAVKKFLKLCRASPEVAEIMHDRSYWTKPTEMWARAFSQWVAMKSGDEGHMATLRAMQESPRAHQWSDESFAPIGAALEEILRIRGLLR